MKKIILIVIVASITLLAGWLLGLSYHNGVVWPLWVVGACVLIYGFRKVYFRKGGQIYIYIKVLEALGGYDKKHPLTGHPGRRVAHFRRFGDSVVYDFEIISKKPYAKLNMSFQLSPSRVKLLWGQIKRDVESFRSKHPSLEEIQLDNTLLFTGSYHCSLKFEVNRAFCLEELLLIASFFKERIEEQYSSCVEDYLGFQGLDGDYDLRFYVRYVSGVARESYKTKGTDVFKVASLTSNCVSLLNVNNKFTNKKAVTGINTVIADKENQSNGNDKIESIGVIIIDKKEFDDVKKRYSEACHK